MIETASKATRSEPETIGRLLERLLAAPLHPLTERAPEQRSVYVIYDQDGVCVHVGQGGTRGKGTLRKRLRNHLRGPSSFRRLFYDRDRSKLHGHQVRWLVVEDARQRSLLEHLAAGTLCPRHVPVAERLDRETDRGGLIVARSADLARRIPE